jgi:hypothetical protein
MADSFVFIAPADALRSSWAVGPGGIMDLAFKNIRFVPVIHRRVTFAEQVRRAALEWQPELIAVELPATLQHWIEDGIERLPQISAVCWTEAEAPDSAHFLPIDPCDGLIEAVRLGIDHGLPVAYIDLDLPNLQEAHQSLPDDLIVDKTGLERFVEAATAMTAAETPDIETLAREAHMARCLRDLAGGGKRVLCVIGLGHYERVRRWTEEGIGELPEEVASIAGLRERPGARLAHVQPESLRAMLGEIPHVTWLYEQTRELLELSGESRFDKLAAVRDLLKEAESHYEKTYRERINMTQWRGLLQYLRNLAWVRKRLRPNLAEVVCAARAIVDNDYGWLVFEQAISYPPQLDRDPELPTIKVVGIDGRFEDGEWATKIKPRWQGPAEHAPILGSRRRPPPRMREMWKLLWDHEFSGRRICSWPPEDDIQERFMHYVRKRALQRITDDRKEVQEFSTSLMDGLEIRETMRNWRQGKLYVQQTPRAAGRVGSVVLIFADEPIDDANSWRSTLYAEHRNESDIAFFATPLGGNVVGPRICRTEFGGILSIWPAWGIPDVWRFQMSPMLRRASDALLAAGILFSPDRYVAYVAARPPREPLRALAAANRKQIVYLPLTTFSRSHLRKVRRFHILDGHETRSWARDYIFDD